MKSSTAYVLGTPLQRTNYADLTNELQELSRQPRPIAVDFTNTHIVTMRRHTHQFRKWSSAFDYFVPDATPLIWCLNLQGSKLRDRVYGPTFMRECVLSSPKPFKHYLLGGSDECVHRLQDFFLSRNPAVNFIGARNGYFKPEDEVEIVQEINDRSPDFLWIGLGTPKQQEWVHRHKNLICRGVILTVGFAFDVNAGMKPDAPPWVQRAGLTWLHRLCSEPRRLVPRYLKWNSLFLCYLLWDGLRGRAWGRLG